MKRIFLIQAILVFAFGLASCNKSNPDSDGKSWNTIHLNPNKTWTRSRIPAYVGDISAFPPQLQRVINQRFANRAQLGSSGVIIVGMNDVTANAKAISAAAASGAFVVVPSNVDLSLLGADPLLLPKSSGGASPLFVCFSGWGNGQYYVMYDEPETGLPSPGESSINASEWNELIQKNRALPDDGGVSLTDYDNDPAHNENYYQTRMDPFVDWLSAEYAKRLFVKSDTGSDYDKIERNIEQSGQRLTVNCPISINAYIDQATWSEPDYLNKSSSVSIDFWVYPSYMLSSTNDKAGDYYNVVQCITPHNESMWGPYVGAHGACRNRIYGFWFDQMDVKTSLLDANGNAIPGLIYYSRPIPENPNSSKQYSEGTSYSYSGSISAGVSGGQPYFVESVSGSATYSTSTSYTLETINYSLDSSSSDVKYHYWSENVVLTDDWDDWDKINRNFPAPVRTEFSGHSSWVWHVPSSVVTDGDTQQFQLQTTVSINYCTWYHWRASIEYDDNKKGHRVDLPVQTWTLDRPDRTPWGFVQLRNASDYEMAHVSIYPKGHESEPPVAVLPTSYGKGEEARGALVEGTYSITWDFVDGNTGTVLSSWIYEDVNIKQGGDVESATVKISTVDGKKRQ